MGIPLSAYKKKNIKKLIHSTANVTVIQLNNALIKGKSVR